MGVKEELWERLSILEVSGLTSAESTDYCKKVIDKLFQERNDIEEEKMAMFVTHLAMASQRAIDGTDENPIGKEVLEAVKLETVYPEAERISRELLACTDIHFPQTEQEYLVVHLCNLFS